MGSLTNPRSANFRTRTDTSNQMSLVFEGNELDTYISREVPIPEGDKGKILTQEELGQGQEDH